MSRSRARIALARLAGSTLAFKTMLMAIECQ
jgi:hypothetical protein